MSERLQCSPRRVWLVLARSGKGRRLRSILPQKILPDINFGNKQKVGFLDPHAGKRVCVECRTHAADRRFWMIENIHVNQGGGVFLEIFTLLACKLLWIGGRDGNTCRIIGSAMGDGHSRRPIKNI
ncbi:hypothetical protein BN2497_7407 [Janthinobacterium sp. CG23_2]|nr:hypothetical protein BN2497_7407 [Janthinobacterium sp. CG23_2]CUU30101.1 hypothetical protein BN3177_7407 [Janthinobacterium sp. CG23_2]